MTQRGRTHKTRATTIDEVAFNDEREWVREAVRLRLRDDMSYQAIANRLGISYRRVYKALNRETVRVWDSESDKRNRRELTKRQLARRKAKAAECSRCGRKLTTRYPKAQPPICGFCRKKEGWRQAGLDERNAAALRMREEDKASIMEIAAAFDVSVQHTYLILRDARELRARNGQG